MTKKIFSSTMTVVISVLLLSFLMITGVLYEHFENLRLDQLKMTADFAVKGMEEKGAAYFDGLDTEGCRITWINADGTVLYDSHSNADGMENHWNRDEVQEALENASGVSVRRSSTLSERTIYYAVRLEDGTVLRLSVAQKSILLMLGGMLSPFFFILLAALILSGVLSYRVSRRIVCPLSQIDLQHPEQANTYEELTPFLRRITAQNHEIENRVREIQRQQREFSMITENMSEGLFVIDHECRILLYNRSALRIFGIAQCETGQDLLTINRSKGFREAVDAALRGSHTQQILKLHDRIYQILANAVYDPDHAEEQQLGAVILILDVTEREAQERYRREFTANVSHELKTPLTSISGIAEIMQNGLVKQEDMVRFAGTIYTEAQRLITLIGDIIKLSRLDEQQVELEWVSVDLLMVIREAADMLSHTAKKNNVQIITGGVHGTVYGVRQVLTEMAYNLCENAVKYNRNGGTVWVNVTQNGTETILTVRDNGIGIPASAQPRVFERFYRVDKSHSKAVGGTGLGLSIVKHGAMLHHAEIELHSEEGAGTEIVVRFPQK